MTTRTGAGAMRRPGAVACIAVLLLLAGHGAGDAAAQRERMGPSPVLPLDVVWETDLGLGPAVHPAVDDQHVYVSLRDGTFVAVRLSTGEPVWSRDRPVDLPPVAGDGLVVAHAGRLLVGFRAGDGRLVWTRHLEASIRTLTLSHGWLVAGRRDGILLALRAADGVELWRRDLGAATAVAPAVAGPRIFASLADGRISAVDLETGDLAWERTITGTPQHVLPLDALFVGSTDNFFYRLAMTDGRPEWFWRTGGDIVGVPVVDEDRVYFSSLDNIVRALDRRSGVQQWRRPLAGRPAAGPLRVETAIVIAGRSPVVQLFHASSGSPMGRYVAPAELAAPPYLGDIPDGAVRMLLVMGNGRLRALGPARGPAQLRSSFPPHPLVPHPDRLTPDVLVRWYPAGAPAPPPRAHARRFTVQLAIFGQVDRAEAFAQSLRTLGYAAYVTRPRPPRRGQLHRVRIGRALGFGDATRLTDRLAADGAFDARVLTDDGPS